MDIQNLMLEITESMLIGDEERVMKIMDYIKQQGLKLSIDDFGTGYSSLSYLKRFPLDELKVDRSFIIEVPSKKDDCAIVKAIIAMAHSLELSVVAEGVEEQNQLEFLKEVGCDIIQGFYFSKPLVADEFEQYVLSKNDLINTCN
ncbi:EAL domain-containing protein [Psychromonas sp. KJ10-10]|uniref:EAL domain-containing protein n=1 Tax=Psychromonas sp. KJ10-10 TaxID=3391823 RepID=UPI0039B511D3